MTDRPDKQNDAMSGSPSDREKSVSDRSSSNIGKSMTPGSTGGRTDRGQQKDEDMGGSPSKGGMGNPSSR